MTPKVSWMRPSMWCMTNKTRNSKVNKQRVPMMEQIRRMVRGVFGWDCPFYRLLGKMLNQISILHSEGLKTARQLSRLKAASKGGTAEAIQFSRLKYPFFVRPGMKDVSVVINNFIREEYGAIEPAFSPKVLVDGGAYIGDTSAYFLSKYPSLRSIAFEPMLDSFSMAKQNLALYGDRVELLQIALTADGQPISMTGEQTGAHASSKSEVKVQTMNIEQILARLPENRIDILKLDVEGAEGSIFADADAADRWLPRIGFIIVETHGDDVTKTVLGALQAANWAAQRVRNLYFCKP